MKIEVGNSFLGNEKFLRLGQAAEGNFGQRKNVYEANFGQLINVFEDGKVSEERREEREELKLELTLSL